MKKLKLLKILSLCLILPVLLSGLAVLAGCDVVTGSGETSTFELTHSDFSRVEIATGFNVEITRADEFFVGITLDKSLYEYLSIAQRGDTLHIGLKANYTYTAATREAVIHLPDLRRLELSGGSKAVVAGFYVDHAVDFELSGGSALTGNIEMSNSTFTLSGESFMEITGTAPGIKLNASGGSDVNLAEFPVTAANIELSGSSHAVINVSDVMDVNLSGGANLEYIGSPKLGSMKMSGGSTLNQKEP